MFMKRKLFVNIAVVFWVFGIMGCGMEKETELDEDEYVITDIDKYNEESNIYVSGEDKQRKITGVWKLREEENEYYVFNYMGEVRGYRLKKDENESKYWQWRIEEDGCLSIGVRGDEYIYTAFDVSDVELVMYDVDGKSVYYDRISEIYTQEYDVLIGEWTTDEGKTISIKRNFLIDNRKKYCISDGKIFISESDGLVYKIYDYQVDEEQLILGNTLYTKKR